MENNEIKFKIWALVFSHNMVGFPMDIFTVCVKADSIDEAVKFGLKSAIKKYGLDEKSLGDWRLIARDDLEVVIPYEFTPENRVYKSMFSADECHPTGPHPEEYKGTQFEGADKERYTLANEGTDIEEEIEEKEEVDVSPGIRSFEDSIQSID